MKSNRIRGWVRWMFQNLPLPAAQEVPDSSSGVTPSVVMKNDGVLYHQVMSFSPDHDFFAKVKEPLQHPVQHKRWTYPCCRAINTKHQQRWARWWCTTPSKRLAKVINKGATILKVGLHKCCTPVNKAMSEILNYCHYFLSNPCRPIYLAFVKGWIPGTNRERLICWPIFIETSAFKFVFSLYKLLTITSETLCEKEWLTDWLTYQRTAETTGARNVKFGM